jgi:uncharacterized protein
MRIAIPTTCLGRWCCNLMPPGGVIDLDEARMRLLIDAIRHHTAGTFSFERTIGCCWDADRLDLRSVAVEPDAGNMSTEAARAILLSA